MLGTCGRQGLASYVLAGGSLSVCRKNCRVGGHVWVVTSFDDRETERRGRFDALYAAYFSSIFVYVHRRLPPGDSEAHDVVAEVFAVAWRRIADVPPAPEDRLWLFGVARRCLARARRTSFRRARLHARLAEDADRRSGPRGDGDPTIAEVRAAIDRLRPRDREVLMLVMWEQLTHAEAARALGCSANAVAIRLHRAKQRLRGELELPMRAAAPVINREASR